MVHSNWAIMTYPIYILDVKTGEMLHTIRLGEIGWARRIGIRLTMMYGDYHVSPDERRLLLGPTKPTAIIVDLKDMETIYEPYLNAWWFGARPKFMKKFERLGGSVELMKKRVPEKALKWLPWKSLLEGGYGGFPDNNHVLICTTREARMYDLRTGELIAGKTNPYVLKSLFETHILGVGGKISVLSVSSVKLPPQPILIVGNILARYGGHWHLDSPTLRSAMEAYPYPGDARRIVCRLKRVSTKDMYLLTYDYLNNIVPNWRGFSEDGWPTPMYGLGRRIIREYRSKIEDVIDVNVMGVKLSGPARFAVDPRGRFVVIPYRFWVRYRKFGERREGLFWFVVWLDLSSGRVLNVWFSSGEGDPLGVYVLPDGSSVVYLAGMRVAVFDSSYRLVRWLGRLVREERKRLVDEFNRRAGVRGFFWGEPCVSPDLRGVVVPFYRRTGEFEEAGILEDGMPREFLDDSRYYALSERARRDFRTLYLAFYDWDWELEGFASFSDSEERAIIHPGRPFWF